MTLAEAYPDFKFLHAMQPRLDKAGATVEDFIKIVCDGKTSHGSIPPEITARGMAATINFLGQFGWPKVANLIVEVYP